MAAITPTKDTTPVLHEFKVSLTVTFDMETNRVCIQAPFTDRRGRQWENKAFVSIDTVLDKNNILVDPNFRYIVGSKIAAELRRTKQYLTRFDKPPSAIRVLAHKSVEAALCCSIPSEILDSWKAHAAKGKVFPTGNTLLGLIDTFMEE